jgi:hypothetical protein
VGYESNDLTVKKNAFLVLWIVLWSCNGQDSKKVNNESAFISNLPFVKIILPEGDSAQFLIDTGSPVCVGDSSFFSERKPFCKAVDSVPVGGTPNEKMIITPLYDCFNFTYKSENYADLLFLELNLKKMICIEDGILGGDFLKDKILLLDERSNRIEFLSDNYKEKFPDLDSADFFVHQNKPYISAKLKVSDTISLTGDFLIDSGSEAGIMLYSFASDSIGIHNSDLKKFETIRKGGNVSGDTKRFMLRAESFSLTGKKSAFNSTGPIVYYTKTDKPGKSPFDFSPVGTLGNQILSDYLMILDYKKQKLFFRFSGQKDRMSGYYPPGFSLGEAKNNGLLIAGLIRNAPADSAGIRIGDVLLEINEIKAGPDTYPKIVKLMRQPGTLNLKLQRNDSVFTARVPVRKLL